MSGPDWDTLTAEARAPETRARMLDLIDARAKLRNRHAAVLAQAREQLESAKAARLELDRRIESQTASIADTQAMVDDWLSDMDRIESILRATAGSMN